MPALAAYAAINLGALLMNRLGFTSDRFVWMAPSLLVAYVIFRPKAGRPMTQLLRPGHVALFGRVARAHDRRPLAVLSGPRHVLARGRRPSDHREGFFDTDPYTFTFTGKPWIPHQWLGECIMAVAHSIGGFDTLLLGTATLLAAVYAGIGVRLLRAAFTRRSLR